MFSRRVCVSFVVLLAVAILLSAAPVAQAQEGEDGSVYLPLVVDEGQPSQENTSAPTPTPTPTETQEVQAAIVGGVNAGHGQFPWMVALIWAVDKPDVHKGQFCGGTVVASEWILTAAHCVYTDSSDNNPRLLQPDEIDVAVSVTNLEEPESDMQIIDVKDIKTHDSYNQEFVDEDIALLHLSTPLDTRSIPPIKIIQKNDPNNLLELGSPSLITGWGWTKGRAWKEKDKNPPILQLAYVPIASKSECAEYVSVETIPEYMLCAGYGGDVDISSCHGDSGGPLARRSPEGEWVQVGTVSFGQPRCPSNNNYAVYTNLSSPLLRNWINQHVPELNESDPSTVTPEPPVTVTPSPGSNCTLNPSLPGIVLYSETNYSGRCSHLTTNNPNLGNLTVGDNAVSSIRVNGSYQVKLYEDVNYGGRREEVSSDDPNLDIRSLGEQFSSVKIIPRQGCENEDEDGVYLYGEKDYDGPCVYLVASLDRLETTVVGDDNVSSVRINGDYRVELYEDENLDGRSEEVGSSDPNLDRRSLGNQFSSVRIRTTTKCNNISLPGVYIYDEKDFDGNCAYLSESEPDLGNTAVGDDDLKSIRIVGPLYVQIHEHKNYGGRHAETSRDRRDMTTSSLGNQFSSVRVLRVNTPPYTPTSLQPENNSTVSSEAPPILCWQNNGDPENDALWFFVEISGNGVQQTSDWQRGTCWQPTDLNEGEYTWRIRARDDHPEPKTSTWSERYSFTIEPPKPPASDQKANAIDISDPVPFGDAFDITWATIDDDDAHGCGNPAGSIWYKYTPSHDHIGGFDITNVFIGQTPLPLLEGVKLAILHDSYLLG